MEKEYRTQSPEETRTLGARIALRVASGLVVLRGELGAGKTKLASGLLEALGAEGPYQSPTFMLMKEYHLPQRTETGIERVYHVDAYRLEAKDFESLGFQEWLEDSAALTLLEWPEKVETLLPKKRTEVRIMQLSETERQITVTIFNGA